LPDVQFIEEGWCHEANGPMSVMEDGWTRYCFSSQLNDHISSSYFLLSFNSGDVLNSSIKLNLRLVHFDDWLSQANNIFSRLHRIRKSLEDYGMPATYQGSQFHVT
jgi:hypothetical protein